MNRSSTRRFLSQTSSFSPGTLRRLRSTARKVQFSDASRNKQTLNDKKKSINSQPLPTTNDQEMTPSNIIDAISLSDHELHNTITNQMNISNHSPSISDSEENDDFTTSNNSNMNNSKKQQLSKKTEVLKFFDELDNYASYQCKLCDTVGITLTKLSELKNVIHI